MAMRVLQVADQQNSFASYKYARKLARRLEKMGLKSMLYSDKITDAAEIIARKKPDIIHLHYHPDARRLRRIMRAADEAGVPVIMTYHRVARIDESRQSHLNKCLKRTRRAIFLTQPDWDAASAINPQLRDAGDVIRVPSPHNVPEELLSAKAAQQDRFFAQKSPNSTLLYCDRIQPYQGIESMLDRIGSFPKGLDVIIAGTVPQGEGSFAKLIKTRVNYDQLPVQWSVSKRPMGTRQIANLTQKAMFAYLPNGAPERDDYEGASMHSMLIPVLARMRTLVFSHRGHETTDELEQCVWFLDRPEDIVETIAALHRTPARFYDKIKEAEAFAIAMDWPELGKQMAEHYKAMLA